VCVQNCWIRACRNPQRFESEGAFRSWVLRLLISEALSIRDEEFTQDSGDARNAASESFSSHLKSSVENLESESLGTPTSLLNKQCG
jgi:DNA-directed RNA polymerase specialized sigma24 family protein